MLPKTDNPRYLLKTSGMNYKLVFLSLSKAKTGFEKKVKMLSNWVKHQEKNVSLNEDEDFFHVDF